MNCCTYNCHQGQHCPARATPAAPADKALPIDVAEPDRGPSSATAMAVFMLTLGIAIGAGAVVIGRGWPAA